MSDCWELVRKHPAPSSVEGQNSAVCVLFCLPEFPSGMNLHLPTLALCLRTHPVLTTFHSLSSFPVLPTGVSWTAVPDRALAFQPVALRLLPGKRKLRQRPFPQSTQLISLFLEPKFFPHWSYKIPEQFGGILFVLSIIVLIIKGKLVGRGGFICPVQAEWPFDIFLHNQNKQCHN